MTTTYKGRQIKSNRSDNGEMIHEVQGQTGVIKFTTIAKAMEFIDTLPATV